MANYRFIVVYSEEHKNYLASVPELEGCQIEAETRSEAVAKLEEELEAQLANMKEQGITPPPPLDTQQFNGELELKISPVLHRDLAIRAMEEQVKLEALMTEILTRGVAFRGPRKKQTQNDNRGNRKREGQGQRYHDIMENRADFIEYVRSLDNGGGGGHRGGGRGGKRG